MGREVGEGHGRVIKKRRAQGWQKMVLFEQQQV
jgi:hypothetical protein